MGRFQKYMIIVLGVTAAIWLVVAVINYRQEGDFDFGGLVVLGLAILAVALTGTSRSS